MSGNPYDTPKMGGGFDEGGFGGGDGNRNLAADRISGPAIGIIVTGAIGLVFGGLALVLNLVGVGLAGAAGGEDGLPVMMQGTLGIVQSVIGLAASVFVVIGGLKMKKLESYPLSLAAAIVVMVPFISPCCCIGIPVGIWALVVMNDPGVKNYFT